MQRIRNAGQNHDFRYARLANEIETKIMMGVYKAGEKLPSLRKLHDHTGMSISTVYQAYIELEKRGVVEPRLKSGFYVKALLRNILPTPESKPPESVPRKVTINSLTDSLIKSMSDPSVLQLGGAVPAPELLPCKELFRSVKSDYTNRMKTGITHYEHPAGSLELRRQIAKRMLGLNMKITCKDLIVTNGCLDAIHLCLRAVARPGDTIVVESPTFGCFLQLIQDMDMMALEVPADPENGVDLNALEKALSRNDVKACIFISNFHNPLGCSMSRERKKRVVECLAKRNIPIIEDDINGDLYFGKTRPGTFKQFDRKGLVLYCSSFSKTLAPGLRVGWTAPGGYKEAVKRLKLNTAIASPSLNQEMIAEFLKSGSYERHLRKLRNALKNQVANTALAIARYLPEGVKITAPQGGIVLWVQLDDAVDGVQVWHEAGKHNISIVPGALCSNSGNYNNYIRISYGQPWNERIEKGIATLGRIIEKLGKGC